jgi:YebC/PmpR family DNA-binding regulatory protein
MSGHSKWATTKHKKAVVDSRRAKMFAKLIKNIEVAARMGGGDISGNPTLYDAIQKAKKSSVPNDNIDRAVKRGSGAEAGGADYTTIMYEGYGPAGVAMLIECLTDNKNRAAMEVRTAMTRNGGSLADPGSVSFLFNRKGVVLVPAAQDGKTVTEDDVLEAALDAGAEDVQDLGESFEVVSEATDLVAVRTALQAAGIDYDSAEAEFVPDMQVQLDKDDAAKLFRLIEALEDSDDVQNVFANFDVPDEVMAELDASRRWSRGQHGTSSLLDQRRGVSHRRRPARR